MATTSAFRVASRQSSRIPNCSFRGLMIRRLTPVAGVSAGAGPANPDLKGYSYRGRAPSWLTAPFPPTGKQPRDEPLRGGSHHQRVAIALSLTPKKGRLCSCTGGPFRRGLSTAPRSPAESPRPGWPPPGLPSRPTADGHRPDR